MKKNILGVLVLSTIAASSIVSCSSGSSGPTATSAITVTRLTPPSGFTQKVGGPSSPVYIDVATDQLAIPGNGQYVIVDIPSHSAIVNISNAGSNATVEPTNEGLLIGAPDTIYLIQADTNSNTAAQTKISNDKNSNQKAVTNNSGNCLNVNGNTCTPVTVTVNGEVIIITSISDLLASGISRDQAEQILKEINASVSTQTAAVTGTTALTTIASPRAILTETSTGSGTNNAIVATDKTSSQNIDTTGCTGIGNNIKTLAATYNGTQFLGIGDTNGVVCMGQLNATTNKYDWAVLSAQAPTGRGAGNYKPGAVTNFGFHDNEDGKTFLGYWNIASPANIYRVVGTTTPTQNAHDGQFYAQSFWNVTLAGQQKNNTTGDTITFTATSGSTMPSTTSSYTACTANDGTLFLLNAANNAYKLAKDTSIWNSAETKATISGNVVSMYSTGTNTGCNATTSNGTTYTLN